MRHDHSVKLVMVLAFVTGCESGIGDGPRLDQANEPPVANSSTIMINQPIGMQFTPTTNSLVAVEVLLRTVNPSGAATITLDIRTETIDGPLLGASFRLLGEEEVAEGFEGWLRFDFSKRPTPTGQSYVIILESTTNTHAWVHGGDYAEGHGYFQGAASGHDFGFRTYGE